MYSARSLGLTVHGSSGGEELVLCPFHADRKPSAWYSQSKGMFYCAVCGFGLNLPQLIVRLGLDVEEIEESQHRDLPDFSLLKDDTMMDFGEAHYHDYFSKRLVSPKTIEEYGVRWKSSSPEAAVLPITSFFGEREGLCYRYLNSQEAGTRYRVLGNPTPLWPMHRLARAGRTILVTEGAFSAMRIASYLEGLGLEWDIFALLGAKSNRDIVSVIKPFNAIVLYDNDQAGRRACQKLRELHPTVKAWTLTTSPDDMDDAEIKNLLQRLERKL